jgi:hypothetical protein
MVMLPPPKSLTSPKAAKPPPPSLQARWERFRLTLFCALYALCCFVVVFAKLDSKEKIHIQMFYISLAFMQFLIAFFVFFYPLASFLDAEKREYRKRSQEGRPPLWLVFLYTFGLVFAAIGGIFLWLFRRGWLS